MKVLIPLLSKHESNEEFIEKAVRKADEVLLLIVIEKEDSSFLKAADISSSTHFLEKVKKMIGKKRKKCEEFTEWGETSTKIKNTAIINNVDKIALLKQENQYFEDLVKKLREEKDLRNKIEIIKVDLEKIKEEASQEKNKENEKKKDSAEEQKTEEKKEKISEKEEIKKIKSIANQIIKTGFKGIDSIKKFRLK